MYKWERTTKLVGQESPCRDCKAESTGCKCQLFKDWFSVNFEDWKRRVLEYAGKER